MLNLRKGDNIEESKKIKVKSIGRWEIGNLKGGFR